MTERKGKLLLRLHVYDWLASDHVTLHRSLMATDSDSGVYLQSWSADVFSFSSFFNCFYLI